MTHFNMREAFTRLCAEVVRNDLIVLCFHDNAMIKPTITSGWAGAMSLKGDTVNGYEVAFCVSGDDDRTLSAVFEGRDGMQMETLRPDTESAMYQFMDRHLAH